MPMQIGRAPPAALPHRLHQFFVIAEAVEQPRLPGRKKGQHQGGGQHYGQKLLHEGERHIRILFAVDQAAIGE